MTTVAHMRLFVAVQPPEHVVEDLEEFLAPRRAAGDFRWTPPDQWHVTLAFMAQAPDRVLDDLTERLTRAGRRRTPFGLRVAGGGAFPNAARARVVYGDVRGAEASDADRDLTELRRLATGARAAASKAGAEPTGGPFRPHLTLARVGRPQEVSNWVRLLDAYRGPEWEVHEFSLVVSHLGEGPRKRPRHEVLERFPLGRLGAGGRLAANP